MPSKPFGEMICPVCKKMFVCHYVSTWAYKKYSKTDYLVFCSYSCMREYDKVKEELKKNTPSRKKGKKKTYACTD